VVEALPAAVWSAGGVLEVLVVLWSAGGCVPEVAEFGGTEAVPPEFASVVLCGEPTPVLDGFVFTWLLLLVLAELEVIWLLSGGLVLDGAVVLAGDVALDGLWVVWSVLAGGVVLDGVCVVAPLLWSVFEVVLVVVVD
jgi:hypothetical protein